MNIRLKKLSARLSFEVLATLVLVILKLKGVITWSWWAVTFLLWVDILGMAIMWGFLFAIALFYRDKDEEEHL